MSFSLFAESGIIGTVAYRNNGLAIKDLNQNREEKL
jgi:hypothetical protein